MGDYVLTTSELCKYYGSNLILKEVTISVLFKSIYGLVGENGAVVFSERMVVMYVGYWHMHSAEPSGLRCVSERTLCGT